MSEHMAMLYLLLELCSILVEDASPAQKPKILPQDIFHTATNRACEAASDISLGTAEVGNSNTSSSFIIIMVITLDFTSVRFFLYICSGSSRPLSTSVLEHSVLCYLTGDTTIPSADFGFMCFYFCVFV